jgi:diaminopimelate epimerase
MRQSLHFTKASGAGNDFVIVDNRDGAVQQGKNDLAALLCSRHFGIGADGLLLLEKSSKADFAMRYYNADGSYGGMCGNGGRCLARYAFLHGVAGETMRFEALDHVYDACVVGDQVRLHMKDPRNLATDVRLDVGSVPLIGTFIDTGSPHMVLFVDELEDLDVTGLGRKIREHGPEGTNVNFALVLPDGSIRLRTYERGVEAETLACGTGSVATAVVAFTTKRVSHTNVKIRVRSGELLTVRFTPEAESITDVWLEGSAHILFSGNVLVDFGKRELSAEILKQGTTP